MATHSAPTPPQICGAPPKLDKALFNYMCNSVLMAAADTARIEVLASIIHRGSRSCARETNARPSGQSACPEAYYTELQCVKNGFPTIAVASFPDKLL